MANRGELVVRIARTCRQLGITSLALAPDDQARAWWTSPADEIVPLRGTYLDMNAVLEAARAARADAIHPGYGFLAENADFAEAVIDAGMAWVGPPPAAMRALGDKAAARRLAARIGVPILPGYDGDDQSDAKLLREARASASRCWSSRAPAAAARACTSSRARREPRRSRPGAARGPRLRSATSG